MLTTKQIANIFSIKVDIVRRILARSEFAKYRTENCHFHIKDCRGFHIEFRNYICKYYAK